MPFDLRSPVRLDELNQLDGRRETVQFSSALTEADYALLGAWFADQPTKTLRVYAGVSDGLCKRSVLKEDQDDRCDH